MSRLSKKFLIGVSLVLVLVGGLSLYLNTNFIERYFLYQEKKEISRISNLLLSDKDSLETVIAKLEQSEEVIIAWVKSSDDNDLLNTRLRQAFLDKGVSLNNYWLWDQDQQDIISQGRKIRIYSQEKLNYSILVQYLSIDENFIAIAKIIPAIDKTLALVNRVTAFTFLGGGLLLLLLISILVYKITLPIKKIGETANAISNLNFTTIDIHTGDELEDLAENINVMSGKLKESHELLEEKNAQMEDLLANVSHDLKTPISLIKMYACGIQDQMDDGTFLDTIIVQNNRMEKMVERLLDLAKLQQQECDWQMVNISDILNELLNEYRLQEENKEIQFDSSVQDGVTAYANSDAIYLICSNLLSNAVKYAKDGNINIRLYREAEQSIFCIKNHINENAIIDVQRIWEPFYVAEQSRNKNMSGTGLGLSLVKEVAKKYNIRYECQRDSNTILFSFRFPV